MTTDKSQSKYLDQSEDAQDHSAASTVASEKHTTPTTKSLKSTHAKNAAEHYAAREYATPQPYYADHYIDETPHPVLDSQESPISIDEEARDTLDRYFYENPLSPIRIYITTRSPKGPKLALRPDKQTDKDLAFEVEDYTFLISPHLAHQLGHIRIAAYDMGFQVIPEHPLHQKSHH